MHLRAWQAVFSPREHAPEVILQKSFAEELLGRKPEPDDTVRVADLAKPLLNQELLMRYAERVAAPAERKAAPEKPANQPDPVPGAAYSVVSRVETLEDRGRFPISILTVCGGRREPAYLCRSSWRRTCT